MSKTAAKEYAKGVIEPLKRSGVPNGISDITQMVADAFIAGAKWHKSNQWVKVEEGCNLPKDGMVILVRRYYRNKYGQFTTRITQEYYMEEYGLEIFCSRRCNERITHWMPIPKPI